MAQEKKKATEAIINELQKQKKQLITHDHDETIKSLEVALENYKVDIKKTYQDKISAYKVKLSQDVKQVESSQRYRQMQMILEFRSRLLDDFKIQLENDLLLLREDIKYQEFLKKELESVAHPLTVYCDTKDVKLIKFDNIKTVDMPLGGIKIETSDRIYDFSFATRLEEALKDFQKIPELQIKGGLYE